METKQYHFNFHFKDVNGFSENLTQAFKRMLEADCDDYTGETITEGRPRPPFAQVLIFLTRRKKPRSF